MRTTGWAREKGIRLIVVLDEAWKIAKEENSDAVMIVREGRKYNFQLIVASQNPTDISESIFSNVGTTFILKVKFAQFLDYLQSTLNFSNFMREQISSFGVGQAAVNLAFHTAEKYPSTFILERIVGEEPLKDLFLDLKDVAGENMPRSISFKREELRAKLREFGLSEERVQEITQLFDKKNRHMDVISFVILLERYGVERREITAFLKDLGVDDATIINIFTKADFKKNQIGNREITQVILEED
jgi:hypothetical protein